MSQTYTCMIGGGGGGEGRVVLRYISDREVGRPFLGNLKFRCLGLFLG